MIGWWVSHMQLRGGGIMRLYRYSSYHWMCIMKNVIFHPISPITDHLVPYGAQRSGSCLVTGRVTGWVGDSGPAQQHAQTTTQHQHFHPAITAIQTNRTSHKLTTACKTYRKLKYASYHHVQWVSMSAAQEFIININKQQPVCLGNGVMAANLARLSRAPVSWFLWWALSESQQNPFAPASQKGAKSTCSWFPYFGTGILETIKMYFSGKSKSEVLTLRFHDNCGWGSDGQWHNPPTTPGSLTWIPGTPPPPPTTHHPPPVMVVGGGGGG